MLVGTSEAALQYALGGIGKLGGVSSEQLLIKVRGIDNAILRVAAATGVKIGSEVTEEELQLFLEPLYRTLVFGEDYSAPAMEEILYTALLTAITTTIVEGGDIASYGKNINALLEQSKEQIQEDGEKDLQSGEMPDDAHLEVMGLNDPTARGIMAIHQMDDVVSNSQTEQTLDPLIEGGAVIPNEAMDMARRIKENNGTPLKGYKGGRVYNNTPKDIGAQKLPEGVSYREYDIYPYVKGQNRGVERIVIGDDGSVWYTNDHYQTFTRIE